jgi:hypothetical protein
MLLAQNAQVAHTVHNNGPVTPMKNDPSGTATIFSNFGPTPTDAYNDATGYYLLGPNNSEGLSEQWIGLPFTPKVSAHVTTLSVAVGIISGTSLINVGLYSDASGTVGTVLASGQSTHIPAFGACCTTVNVRIPATAVTAGTQYWIVASTNDTNGPDFTGVFESSNDANTAANVAGGGWFTFSNNWPAAAAKGTVP